MSEIVVVQRQAPLTKLTKVAHVIRDATFITKEANGNELWAFASVEDPSGDSMDDIIVVDGIDTTQYHDPKRGVYLPILPSHIWSLPDGSSPVIGRVEEFRKVKTPEGYEALAFRMSFSPSPLGQEYKQLYLGEPHYMSSFSVGCAVSAYEPIDDAGWKYTKTVLCETSCVAVPANILATVIRSGEDKLSTSIDETKKLLAKIETSLITISEGHERLMSQLESSMQKCVQPLVERLDTLESAVVASTEFTPKSGDRQGNALDEELSSLSKSLNALKSIASKK